MSDFTVLGVGTLELGTVPNDFSGEVLGASINHSYEDIGEERTLLDGTIRPAQTKQTDSFAASCENDLTAAGLYQYLQSNNGDEVEFSFVPNTADGATWAGTVKLQLPANIGSDEYGSPIVSDLELPGVGVFAFTPAT